MVFIFQKKRQNNVRYKMIFNFWEKDTIEKMHIYFGKHSLRVRQLEENSEGNTDIIWKTKKSSALI